MSKKQYIGIIMLAIMILGFAFYWFEFRPAMIKQNCYKSAARGSLFFEDVYKNCLREKGL